MPPRTKLDADPAEPTVDVPAAEAAPAETPADPAEPTVDVPAPVTHVRAVEAFTCSYGQRLLSLVKGEQAVGDVAVFLAGAGVPVEPVED